MANGKILSGAYVPYCLKLEVDQNTLLEMLENCKEKKEVKMQSCKNFFNYPFAKFLVASRLQKNSTEIFGTCCIDTYSISNSVDNMSLFLCTPF